MPRNYAPHEIAAFRKVSGISEMDSREEGDFSEERHRLFNGKTDPNDKLGLAVLEALSLELPPRGWASFGAMKTGFDQHRIRDEKEGRRPLSVSVLAALAGPLPNGARQRVIAPLADALGLVTAVRVSNRDLFAQLLPFALAVLDTYGIGTSPEERERIFGETR